MSDSNSKAALFALALATMIPACAAPAAQAPEGGDETPAESTAPAAVEVTDSDESAESEGKCGADKEGAEGKCGAGKEGTEGKCGADPAEHEGKCAPKEESTTSDAVAPKEPSATAAAPVAAKPAAAKPATKKAKSAEGGCGAGSCS